MGFQYFLPTVNGILFVGLLYINYSNDVGSVARNFPTVFNPAGYAFAIWGLIYGLLFLFVLHSVYACSSSHDIFICSTTMQLLFMLSILFNGAWVLIWCSRKLLLSIVPMAFLWVTLFAIWLQSIRYISPMVPGKHEEYASHSWIDFITIRLPFAIYFSWTTVAFSINLAVSADAVGHEISLPIVILELSSVTLGALMTLIFASDIVYSLTLIWAVAAIVVRTGDRGYTSVQAVALESLIVVSGALLVYLSYRLVETRNFVLYSRTTAPLNAGGYGSIP